MRKPAAFVAGSFKKPNKEKSNMEKFSLEKYIENPQREIVTRAGLHARIICIDRMSSDRPIIALVTRNGVEEPLAYEIDGSYAEQEHKHDLFFVHNPSRWVFLYKLKGYDTVFASFAYETKEEAEVAAYGQKETSELLTIKEITF